MKFNTGEFYENLSTHSYFGEDRTTITGNLYEDLHVFMSVKGG
jgi:hypothetical protein